MAVEVRPGAGAPTAPLGVALAGGDDHTGGVHDWLEREIVMPGRLPLALALVSFVLTFLVTRAITRAIRAGVGPVRNVTTGDLHIHHVVPGVVALLSGGVLLLSAARVGFWHSFGAVLFGIGAALVLDEFALILHLNDVYWKREGELSVDAITVAMAVMAAALIVAAPDNPPGPDRTDPHLRAVAPALFVLTWIVPTGITVLKGRLLLAALSVLSPVFGWWGAVRLARPTSPWAAVAYQHNPAKQTKAQYRAAKSDRRVAPVRRWWSEHVFGLALDDDSATASSEATATPDATPPEVTPSADAPADLRGRSN